MPRPVMSLLADRTVERLASRTGREHGSAYKRLCNGGVFGEDLIGTPYRMNAVLPSYNISATEIRWIFNFSESRAEASFKDTMDDPSLFF
ncbi:hypothetical protein TESG_08653 [Trichophyton tonsurans CBS 112818]|uniref:Uncharacterized protein n=1 Tax=Trichophyton tonsurans (strain CBS 112818) TaxID=647933 RepID=F2SA18_TRIT1|nr:hypothetical protein TESG_08653 [Trichophyton tonsurans CBS 112818]